MTSPPMARRTGTPGLPSRSRLGRRRQTAQLQLQIWHSEPWQTLNRGYDGDSGRACRGRDRGVTVTNAAAAVELCSAWNQLQCLV